MGAEQHHVTAALQYLALKPVQMRAPERSKSFWTTRMTLQEGC